MFNTHRQNSTAVFHVHDRRMVIRLRQGPTLVRVTTSRQPMSGQQGRIRRRMPFIIQSAIIIIINRRHEAFRTTKITIQRMTYTGPILRLNPSHPQLPPTLHINTIRPSTNTVHVIFNSTMHTRAAVERQALSRHNISNIAIIISRRTAVFRHILHRVNNNTPRRNTMSILIIIDLIHVVRRNTKPVRSRYTTPAIVTLQVVIQRPRTFTYPNRAGLRVKTIQLTKRIRRTQLTPVRRVIKFPSSRVHTNIITPLMPTTTITSRRARVNNSSVPHTNIKVTSSVQVTRTYNARVQDRRELSVIRQRPAIQVISVKCVRMGLLNMTIQVLSRISRRMAMIINYINRNPAL